MGRMEEAGWYLEIIQENLDARMGVDLEKVNCKNACDAQHVMESLKAIVRFMGYAI